MNLVARVTIYSLLFLAGCSKALDSPTQSTNTPERVNEKPILKDRCNTLTSTQLIRDIETKESTKKTLEAEAKKSPAKENFRKLYTAEAAFMKETTAALETLSHCEDPVKPSVLEEIKKKVATSEANVKYLSENFPEFK